MVVQATERHSLEFTYGKYIELLNTNRTPDSPAGTTTRLPSPRNTEGQSTGLQLLLHPAEIEAAAVMAPV